MEQKANKVTFEQYVRLALSHAEFFRNEDTSWTVEVSVLPGCISWGMTRREAMEMVKDAITFIVGIFSESKLSQSN